MVRRGQGSKPVCSADRIASYVASTERAHTVTARKETQIVKLVSKIAVYEITGDDLSGLVFR